MKAIILSILIILSGCASTNLEKLPISDQTSNAKIPASLLVRCEAIPNFSGNTLGDLYKYDIDLMKLYNDCALSKDKLIDAVK